MKSIALRLWHDHIKKYYKSLLLAQILLIIAAGFSVAQLQLLQPIFDKVMIAGDRTLLWQIPLLYIVYSIGRGISVWIQSWITASVGGHIIADIQNRIFSRLLHIDLANLFTKGTGTLVNRFTYDLILLREILASSFIAIARESVLLIAYIGLMLYQNIKLSLIVIVAYPIIIIPLVYTGNKLRQMSRKHQEQAGAISHFLSDSLKVLRSILIYGAENTMQKKARKSFDKARKLTTWTQIIRSTVTPINEILGGLTISLLLGFGGWQVINQAITIGQFGTFFAAMMLSYQPLRRLSGHNAKIQEGMAVVERMYQLLDQKDITKDIPNAKELIWKSGHIQFINASKVAVENLNDLDSIDEVAEKKQSYQFKNISFTVKPGTSLAIYGPSGSGKTSIVNALLRFTRIDQGKILIDGQDIASIKVASLRKNFAFVSQEALLSHGSALENITMGAKLNKSRLKKALILSQASQFLGSLGKKINNTIGESGSMLSGGQQQRLSLARAFYRDAPIVILDEPTSALDEKIEKKILDNVFNKLKNKSVIFITHNPKNLHYTDNIIVIANQKIIAKGTFQQLIKKGFIKQSL